MVVGITKKEALKRARRLEMEDIIGSGLPAITPTDAELKESGSLHRARIQLMRSPETEGKLQIRKYLDTMSSELGLKLMSAREYKRLHTRGSAVGPAVSKPVKRRKSVVPIKRIIIGAKQKLKRVSLRKPLDIGSAIRGRAKQHKTVARAPLKPKPRKKRQRLHTERSGRNMRALKKAQQNGVRVFSFGDDVWKTKTTRARSRRKRR